MLQNRRPECYVPSQMSWLLLPLLSLCACKKDIDTTGFELGPVQACPSPQTEVTYREQGAAMGLSTNVDAEGFEDEGMMVAVSDFDGDGDLDIVAGGIVSPPTLYSRDGDAFLPRTLSAPLGSPGFSIADLDGDGDPDLLGGTWTLPGQVYLNEGGEFSAEDLPGPDTSSTPGLAFVQEFAPADIDGDGDVDLLALTNGDPDATSAYLLWNQGDGTFEADTTTLPADLTDRAGFDAVFLDWQNDGDLDLYIVNDLGSRYGGNVLFENDRGTLVPAADCSCEVVLDGMGGDAGDYDGDGRVDLYVSATMKNVLLHGEADDSFVDTTFVLGANPVDHADGMGWGVTWLDHDNDGLPDLLVAQGEHAEMDQPHFDAPINLLRQGPGGFEDVAVDLGLEQAGIFRSVVAADHNDDGLLDLLVSQYNKPPLLYLSQGCTRPGWLEVEAPLGSRVEVTAAGITQTDWVDTDSSYGAAGPQRVHFGLGDTQQIDKLRITLTTGETRTLQGTLAARRLVRTID